MNKTIEIYTDGSCNNWTKNKGGYGIVILNGKIETYCGGSYINTTNSRMEILAVVRALMHCSPDNDILVYSDNEYVVNTISKGWLFNWKSSSKSKKNMDLWDQFLFEYERLHRRVELRWIKGHNKNPMNELADQLASQGANLPNIYNDRI